jgi:hypothetical protein
VLSIKNNHQQKFKSMKKLFLATAVIAIAFSSCKKEDNNNNNSKGGIFKGPETEMYHGKAWTWIQLDNQGNPERVAIAINDAALSSVTPGSGSTGSGHTHENNEVLAFHPKAAVTPFQHAWLNWNPNGHPPAGVYDKPHFDLHFYMVPSTEREAYVDPVKLNADPAATYLPANYMGGDPVPTMGKHWVDITSPELNPTNPQPFTQTFIYGSYDSKVVFYEPMITLDFLKTTSNFVRDIPQPAQFQKSGYYPTKMRITKQDGVTNIILEGMVYRGQS